MLLPGTFGSFSAATGLTSAPASSPAASRIGILRTAPIAKKAAAVRIGRRGLMEELVIARSSVCASCRLLCRLRRMHRPEADRDPVPGVDRRDQEGELYQLGLAELRADLVVDGVGDVRLRYQGHRLGPGHRRSLS